MQTIPLQQPATDRNSVILTFAMPRCGSTFSRWASVGLEETIMHHGGRIRHGTRPFEEILASS